MILRSMDTYIFCDEVLVPYVSFCLSWLSSPLRDQWGFVLASRLVYQQVRDNDSQSVTITWSQLCLQWSSDGLCIHAYR